MRRRIILLILAICLAPIVLPLFVIEGAARCISMPFYWVITGEDPFNLIDTIYVFNFISYIENKISTKITI